MMNTKIRLLGMVVALGGALSVFAPASPAVARILTGYGAIKPWPTPAAQDCLSEGYGEVITSCTTPQTLVFPLPFDGSTGFVNAMIVPAGILGAGFTCDVREFSPDGSAFVIGTEVGVAPAPSTAGARVTVNMNAGWTYEAVCSGVPAGRGVASISYPVL